MDTQHEEDLNIEVLFNAAADHLARLASKLDSAALLTLYGLYKQSTVGPCNTSKPGFFDFQAKQKWEAWKSVGDQSKEQSMQKYVAKIDEIDPEWRHSCNLQNNQGRSVFGGPVVSTLMNSADSRLADEEKTIFDWAKEANMAKLHQCFSNGANVDSLDEQGLGLLHWACDRGHQQVVKWLIKNGASVNLQDIDGQTPLHYAYSCNHTAIVDLLVSEKCDTSIKDSQGLTALDTANTDILNVH